MKWVTTGSFPEVQGTGHDRGKRGVRQSGQVEGKDILSLHISLEGNKERKLLWMLPPRVGISRTHVPVL